MSALSGGDTSPGVDLEVHTASGRKMRLPRRVAEQLLPSHASPAAKPRRSQSASPSQLRAAVLDEGAGAAPPAPRAAAPPQGRAVRESIGGVPGRPPRPPQPPPAPRAERPGKSAGAARRQSGAPLPTENETAEDADTSALEKASTKEEPTRVYCQGNLEIAIAVVRIPARGEAAGQSAR